jgi:hypothetical protein
MQQQQWPHALQVPAASPPVAKKQSVPAPEELQQTGQSVWAAIVNSQPLDNMLRVVTVVQQKITEFSGAVSEDAKIVAITKIVLNLRKQNGH